MVTVGVLIGRVQDTEGELSQVLRSGHDIHEHGLVVRHAFQKFAHLFVAAIDQKCVIPLVDQFLLCDALYIGKIHHHALFGLPFRLDDVARQGDLDRIAVPVQVFALAVVVGDAVSCIEFKAACDEHDVRLCSGCDGLYSFRL